LHSVFVARIARHGSLNLSSRRLDDSARRDCETAEGNVDASVVQGPWQYKLCIARPAERFFDGSVHILLKVGIHENLTM
jgi:hypothetical protein